MTEEKKLSESEYIEKMQRMQAEFENFKKRIEKENSEVTSRANADLISNLLPILDNFELSLKYNKDKGIEMIYNQFYKVLEKQGLEVVKTDGDFNAIFHEALEQVAGKKDGAIVEEINKGYLLNGRLLRAAKVKISKVVKNE